MEVFWMMNSALLLNNEKMQSLLQRGLEPKHAVSTRHFAFHHMLLKKGGQDNRKHPHAQHLSKELI